MSEPANVVAIAVVGAHLTGQPLNRQLTRRGGILRETTRTNASYRLYAIRSDRPKPGLMRVSRDGVEVEVEVEVWELSAAGFGSFVAELPQPMTMGKIELADGRLVPGFLVESIGVEGAQDK